MAERSLRDAVEPLVVRVLCGVVSCVLLISVCVRAYQVYKLAKVSVKRFCETQMA